MTREIGVTLLRLAVIRRGVIPASWGGKLKTVVQAVAIGLFVLPLSGALHMAAEVVMAAAIVLTVVTGVDYVVSAVQGDSPDHRLTAGTNTAGAGVHLMTSLVPALFSAPSRRNRTKESTMASLVREVIGDVLRQARMSQGRTLREVSDSARVSLGYLSEVERGRKEPSSELLSAICDALQVPLSAVLTDAGERMAAERMSAPGRISDSGPAAEQLVAPSTSAPRSSFRRWRRWRWPDAGETVSTRVGIRADPLN